MPTQAYTLCPPGTGEAYEVEGGVTVGADGLTVTSDCEIQCWSLRMPMDAPIGAAVRGHAVSRPLSCRRQVRLFVNERVCRHALSRRICVCECCVRHWALSGSGVVGVAKCGAGEPTTSQAALRTSLMEAQCGVVGGRSTATDERRCAVAVCAVQAGRCAASSDRLNGRVVSYGLAHYIARGTPERISSSRATRGLDAVACTFCVLAQPCDLGSLRPAG